MFICLLSKINAVYSIHRTAQGALNSWSLKMNTVCFWPRIEMERNLIKAAAELLSNSDCPLLHLRVAQAVRDVLSEVARGYYSCELAVEKLTTKVFFIKLKGFNK